LAILAKVVFLDALGASPRGIADREYVFAGYKGMFAIEEKKEGLGQAAFSVEVIALSYL
jgi:hypothetical protein